MSGIMKAAVVVFSAGLCAGAQAQSCDGQWLPVGAGFDHEIWAMTPYQGELVAVGDFDHVPGAATAGIARWNGSDWKDMSANGAFFPRAVRVQGGVLYLGSIFSPPAKGIMQWTGSAWATLAEAIPMSSVSSTCFTLAEYQGKLLAAGTLRGAATTNAAGFVWNGAQWENLGSVLTIGSSVRTSCVYQGILYIAGFNSTQLINSMDTRSGSVLRYDGTNWTRVGMYGVTSGQGSIALRVYQDKLYMASANVRAPGGLNYGPLATWDGIEVKAAGALTFEGEVAAMTEYNGDLIIGGAFVNGFGVGANGVVRWNGTNFAALGQGITGASSTGRRVNCLDVYNGELIAGGNFDTAGGVASPYFARWTDNPKPWVAVSPVSQPANEGLTLTLSAAAASGYANATYKWQRDGVDVANGSGGASAGGGTVSGASGTLTSPSDGSSVLLTINGIQASDAGAYTIVFSNGCNDATSAAAAVSVNTCPGDLNTDGVIDDADFTIFVGAYNVLVCEDPAMPVGCPADLNGDGLVEDLDFQVFIVGYDALVCE